MKTIYNVAVLMEDQTQCDRMKQLCLDNGLPIWEYEEDPYVAFEFDYGAKYFKYSSSGFFIGYEHESLVTEYEFIQLLKNNKG